MRTWILTLALLLILTGCGRSVPESVDPVTLQETVTEAEDKPYTIGIAMRAMVDDNLHNADVTLPEVVFPEHGELTEAVHEKITGPFADAYTEYTSRGGIDFNWYTTDYQVYESEEVLAVTVLSYRAGTYVTCPKITGAVVDLETMTLLTMDEVLQARGQTKASLEEKIRKMLPAVWDARYPLWMETITDTFLNADGDLIVTASTLDLHGAPPSNPYLYYNVARDSISIWPYSETLADFADTFKYLPEGYVFDQAVYDAYYSEDHIPETTVIYHDDPGVAPEIMVVPEIEPEILIVPEIEPEIMVVPEIIPEQ